MKDLVQFLVPSEAERPARITVIISGWLWAQRQQREPRGLEKVQLLEWRALLVVAKEDSHVPGATRDSTWGREALGWLGALGWYGMGFRTIVPSAQ